MAENDSFTEDSFVEDSFVEETPKKKVGAESSAMPVLQGSEPSVQSGVKDSEPIDLPKSYQDDRGNYKDLVGGSKYNLLREGKPVTGTWDEATQTFIKDPLLNATPQRKKEVGFLQAVEAGVNLEAPVETQEEIFGRLGVEVDELKKDAKEKLSNIDYITSYPSVQRLGELEKIKNSTEDAKVIEDIDRRIAELRSKKMSDKEFEGIRFDNAEGKVYQNFLPAKPVEEFKGDVKKLPKTDMTVGQAYDEVKDDSDYIQQVQGEIKGYGDMVNQYMVDKLPEETKVKLEALKGTPEYDTELEKELVQSKEVENIIPALAYGLDKKLDALMEVGSNIGLDDDRLVQKKLGDIREKQMFGKNMATTRAEIASSIGGMLPDIAAGGVYSPLMLASMASTMPNDFLEQSIAEQSESGLPIDVNKAKKFALTSTAAQTAMLVGAGKVGAHGLNLVGKTGLKRAGELIYEMAKRGTKDAIVFGGLGTVMQNKINKAYDLAENDEYLKQGLHMAIIGGMFALKEGIGKVKGVSKKTQNEVDYLASYLPEEYTRKQVEQLTEMGKISPADGEETLGKLNTIRAIRNQIPTDLTVGQMDKIYPMWVERRRLQSMTKDASSEFKSVLNGEVEDIDRKILVKAAVPLTSSERAEKNKLSTAEAENKDIDKSRLRYLEQRDEAAKEVNAEKKIEEAKIQADAESSKGGDGEDAKPEAETGVEAVAENGKEEVVAEVDKSLYKDRKLNKIGNEDFYFNETNEYGTGQSFTIENSSGEEIARATLSKDGNYLENIRVDEAYRRRGLATELYDYIEARKGIELSPSKIKQSVPAKKLWEKRNLKKSVSKNANGGLLARALKDAIDQTFSPSKGKPTEDFSATRKEIEARRENELAQDLEFMKGREKSQIENSKKQIKAKYDAELAELNKKEAEQKEKIADNEKDTTGSDRKNEEPAAENIAEGGKEEEYKRLVEPTKPISEMNSQELYDLAVENKKALKEQDKEFAGKTEKEKEDGGYYNAIDDVSDLRDASEKISWIESSEDANEVAKNIRSTVAKMDKNNISEYDLAIINAATLKAEEFGISQKDFIDKVVKAEFERHANVEDAEFMANSLREKIGKAKEETVLATKGLTPQEEAIKFLDDHAVQSKIDTYGIRPDFRMSSEELERGMKQIREGKLDMVAAKNMLTKIAEWKAQGHVDLIHLKGGTTVRLSAPYEIAEALAKMPKEDADVVVELNEKLDSPDFDKLIADNYTDADGNLNREKLAQDLADLKNNAYFGDLLLLDEKDLLNLQNYLKDEKSGTTTQIPNTKSESKIAYRKKSAEEQSADTKPAEVKSNRIQSAKEKLQAAKDKAKAVRDAKKNLKAVDDPFEQAKREAEADRDVFDAYVDLAKAYIKETADKTLHTVEEFAKAFGEKVEDVKSAWDEAMKPRTTSAKNEVTDRELEELGLPERDIPEVKANQKTWEKAKADVDSGKVDPMQIASDVLVQEVPFLSAEHTFALMYAKAKLLKEHDTTFENLQQARASGDKELENLNLQHLAKLNSDYETIATAFGKAGTTAARSMQARSRDTDMDYNLLEVNRQMREASGGKPIPEATQKKIEELVKKNKEAEDKLKQHEERIAELEKSKAIQDEIDAQLKAKGSKTKYTDKAKQAADQIRKLKNKPFTFIDSKGNEITLTQNAIIPYNEIVEAVAKLVETGGKVADHVRTVLAKYKNEDWYKDLSDEDKNSFAEKLSEHLTEDEGKTATDRLKEKIEKGGELKKMKYALKKRQEELVEQGMKNHEDVTGKITSELNGMGMKATEREVRDVLSGYGEVRKPSQEELAKDIREQTAKMRLASGKEDVLSGRAPLKSGFQFDKPNPEIDAIKRELKALIKEKGLDGGGKSEEEIWATAIETWRKRKSSEIERKKETLEKMKRGELPSPKQKIIPKTAEDIKLQSEAQKYKHLIDVEKRKIELANRDWVEKTIDWIPKSKRFSILLGYKVLGKLAAAGAWQSLVMTPTRKVIQTGIGYIPGFSKIAERAPTEGRLIGMVDGKLSAESLAANYSQWWQKAAWSDVYNTLKTGKSEIDNINRKFNGEKDVDEQDWTSFVMNSHAAIKNLPKRSEYFASVQAASEWAVKNGMDIKDAQTQKMIHDLAYGNAVRNIFMNKNRATDAYKMSINYLNKNGGIGGKVAAAMLKVDMPIVQVPTNIANDISSYVAGSAKAAWTVGYHGKGNPENLTPIQADHVMRSLGKQALGAIGMAVAYSFYKSFGGFYHRDVKEKKGAVKEEAIRVGDEEDGVNISSIFLHHPGFVAMQVAADIEHQIERHKNKHTTKPFSLIGAVASAVGSVAKTIPLLESPSETLKVFESEYSLQKTAAQSIAGYIPQVIKEIAKDTDRDKEGDVKKRDAKTFVDQIKVNIPVLREEVKLRR